MTVTADTASGMQPPNARNVRPMTVSGTSNVSPIMDIIQNTTYEVPPIHRIHIKNVSGYHFR